jgi:RNA-binding protein with serine-rich domain 1
MSSTGGSNSPAPVPPQQDADVEMTDNAVITEKPDAKVVIVTNLTRNVVQAHLQTIFGFYGEITKLDLPLFGRCKFLSSLCF